MVSRTLQKRTDGQATGREPTRGMPRYRPPVDIVETPDELRLLADMPGVNPEGIDVHFEGGTLTLYGPVKESRTDGGGYLVREYGIGDYFRAFEIAETIDPESISAEYESGVLTLHLPKVEAAKTRKIEVRTR